jgi:F-type H+-transporting ATPase subunit epsilon
MIRLEIVTPERRVIDAEVDSVTLPTASGEAGILPNHAPLISALKPGILSYTHRGTNDRLAVSSGFVEVNHDTVSVLVDSAETAEDINVDASRAELEEAERAISVAGLVSDEEAEAARETVEHAQARLQITSGK